MSISPVASQPTVEREITELLKQWHVQRDLEQLTHCIDVNPCAMRKLLPAPEALPSVGVDVAQLDQALEACVQARISESKRLCRMLRALESNDPSLQLKLMASHADVVFLGYFDAGARWSPAWVTRLLAAYTIVRLGCLDLRAAFQQVGVDGQDAFTRHLMKETSVVRLNHRLETLVVQQLGKHHILLESVVKCFKVLVWARLLMSADASDDDYTATKVSDCISLQQCVLTAVLGSTVPGYVTQGSHQGEFRAAWPPTNRL